MVLVLLFGKGSPPLCICHLCSQVGVLAEALQETADIRPRQQALHQSWTGCDLLQQ